VGHQEESPEGAAILSARDVSVRFGGIRALQGVSLEVRRGQICGLIGPNGAGKTTFFNAITRLHPVSAGTIALCGRSITDTRPRDIIGLGIARTFQNVGIYGSMSVLDNVMLGAHHRIGGHYAGALFRPGRSRARDRDCRERCAGILRELGMIAVANAPAGSLPYPLQKRMEIARALAAEPVLLLLDEPAGGLTHGEVAEFSDLLSGIRHRRALSILLIEHHMGLVMGLCDRVDVFHLGRNLAGGTPDEVRTDPGVIAAYMGRSAA
jgi:branched-chain amino acid transport system ATP-binding protein